MNIKLKGIHLFADDTGELHTFARKVGLSRSWFHTLPIPHYDVICPFITDRILNQLRKRKDL
jgi:hypothetical protein